MHAIPIAGSRGGCGAHRWSRCCPRRSARRPPRDRRTAGSATRGADSRSYAERDARLGGGPRHPEQRQSSQVRTCVRDITGLGIHALPAGTRERQPTPRAGRGPRARSRTARGRPRSLPGVPRRGTPGLQGGCDTVARAVRPRTARIPGGRATRARGASRPRRRRSGHRGAHTRGAVRDVPASTRGRGRHSMEGRERCRGLVVLRTQRRCAEHRDLSPIPMRQVLLRSAAPSGRSSPRPARSS